MWLAEKYGKRQKSKHGSDWPSARPSGPADLNRKSPSSRPPLWSATMFPDYHAGYLDLWPELQKAGAAGFALGNAVGDGNDFATGVLCFSQRRAARRAGDVPSPQGKTWPTTLIISISCTRLPSLGTAFPFNDFITPRLLSRRKSSLTF